jgi:hypothetical protein
MQAFEIMTDNTENYLPDYPGDNEILSDRSVVNSGNVYNYYTQAISDKICSLLASGKSLSYIHSLPDMPNKETIRRWREKNQEFDKAYSIAREQRADSRFERIDDYKEELHSGKIDADVARVLIAAEQWQAGKENGKKYGDKSTIDVNQTIDINALIIQAASERLSRQGDPAITAQVIDSKPESIEDYL